jgi:S-adenosylmethionine decarboxylase
MPGTEPASRYTELRRQEAASPKVLYAIDAISPAGTAAPDLQALASAATAAVSAARGHVLARSDVTFPNGAITLVLILAESHLSIHTWPEEHLVAIDLFSCGAIDGRLLIDRLVEALALRSVTVRTLPRGAAAS